MQKKTRRGASGREYISAVYELCRVDDTPARTPDQHEHAICRECGIGYTRPRGAMWPYCRTCWSWRRAQRATREAAEALGVRR